jgi:hypothetical protein
MPRCQPGARKAATEPVETAPLFLWTSHGLKELRYPSLKTFGGTRVGLSGAAFNKD